MNPPTSVQKFALVFGIVYALVGVIGFVPGLLQPPPADAPRLAVGAAYGYLLGIFPVNAPHDLVHIVVGVLGVLAAGRLAAARLYCRVVAVVFALLTVMGLVPGLDTTLGLIPIFGADVLLHALTTVASAYFGWVAREAIPHPDIAARRAA
jgi:Domain of unknown function (DUF4383)